MSFFPKVSIVIPVFNGSNFLADAITSALNQEYDNIEILVVNDGSADEGKTEAIALSFGASVRYFRKRNGGVSTALNKAIDEMTGDYFSWLSHDDLYKPNKVKEQIRALRSIPDPEKHILFSDYDILNVDTATKRTVKLERDDPKGFRCRLLMKSDVHGCTMLIPKDAFRVCGKFNPELMATQDYDMWFRLASHYSFVRVPESLVTGRIHGKQARTRMHWRAVAENLNLRKKWIEKVEDEEMVAFTGKPAPICLSILAGDSAKRGDFYLASQTVRRLLGSSAGLSAGQWFIVVRRLSLAFSLGVVRKVCLVVTSRF